MIADHTKTSAELTAAAKANNIPVPPDMDKSHKKKIDKLNASTGEDFRKRYFDEQVSAHKNVVSLFNRYKNGGDVPKLREWPATTLPALQHHLEMAENLDK